MKKLLVLASIMLFATSMMTFAETADKTVTAQNQGQERVRPDRPDFKMPPKGPDFKKRNEEFEKRLNLSEKQKAQAESMRKADFEKMKPVMDKLQQKHKEISDLKNKTDEQSVQRLEQLKKETGALKKELHEQRMQNMKDFESILTKKQQKELAKLKEEGRKKFEQEHKNRPDFNGERGERSPRPDRPMPIEGETK